MDLPPSSPSLSGLSESLPSHVSIPHPSTKAHAPQFQNMPPPLPIAKHPTQPLLAVAVSAGGVDIIHEKRGQPLVRCC